MKIALTSILYTMVFSNILFFILYRLQVVLTTVTIQKWLNFLQSVVSTLRSYKFKHSFQDLLNPLCTCGLHEKSESHFPLYCPSFTAERSAFLSKIREFDGDLLNYIDSVIMHTSLLGKKSFNKITNALVRMQHLISFYLRKSLKDRFRKILYHLIHPKF